MKNQMNLGALESKQWGKRIVYPKVEFVYKKDEENFILSGVKVYYISAILPDSLSNDEIAEDLVNAELFIRGQRTVITNTNIAQMLDTQCRAEEQALTFAVVITKNNLLFPIYQMPETKNGQWYKSNEDSSIGKSFGEPYQILDSDRVIYYTTEDTKARMTNGQSKKSLCTRFNIDLDIARCDMLKHIESFNARNNIEMDNYKIVQKGTRLAAFSAYQRAVPGCKCVAIIPCKLEALNDGGAYMQAEWFRKGMTAYYKEKLGIELNLPSFEGRYVQCRPGSAKTLALLANDKALKARLTVLNKDIIYFNKKDLAKDTATLDLINDAVGKIENKLSQYIIVVGDYPIKNGTVFSVEDFYKDYSINFIGDLNCFKAQCDWSKVSTYNVLASDSYEPFKHGTRLSTQILFSMAYSDAINKSNDTSTENNKDLMTVVKELAQQQGLDIIEAYNSKDSNKVNLEESADRTVINSYRNFCKEVFPSLIENEVKNIEQGMVTTINKLSLNVEGTHCFMVTDLAYMLFGVNVLKDSVECAETYFNGESFEGVFIKYPKMGIGEFSIVRGLTHDEYLDRASKLLDDNQLAIIKRLIKTKVGAIQCPGYRSFFERHAGSDIDGDHASIITEKSVVEIFKRIKPVTLQVLSK